MGLSFATQAAAALPTLSPQTKRAVRAALDVIKKDAVGAPGLDVKLLDQAVGKPPMYRIKAGDYRIAYIVDGRDVVVSRIFHRRDGYGWLERT